MKYIIKPDVCVVVASYPTLTSVTPYVTTKTTIFTSDDIIFKCKDIFDDKIKNTFLAALADWGYYGFKKQSMIMAIRPENIASLNIKQKPPKPTIIPFSNMITKKRISFDEWLKEIGYDLK